jgi:hypothetical protein
MLKQFSSMKKGLAVLLAVLFVVSLTAVAASADRHGHGHHHGGHWGHGGWGYPGWGYGAGCYYMGGILVCPSYDYGGYLI